MSETIEVSVDEQGRIRIPASVSSALGLSAGSKLVVEEDGNDGVVLSIVPTGPAIAERDGLLVAIGEPTEEIVDWVQRDREERIQYLMRGIEP